MHHAVQEDYGRWFPDVETLPPAWSEARAEILQTAFESFVLEACTTIDEHAAGNSRKPLPIHGQMQYLRVVIRLAMLQRRIYWLKSRKVSATWLLCLLLVWRILHRRDRLAGWVTQDEKDGRALLDRWVINGILEGLPDVVLDRYDISTSAGTIHVAKRDGLVWNSRLSAYPKGADQLRQFAHSEVVVDEAHTIRDLEDLLQGISPGLRAREGEEGGQLWLVGVGRRGSHFGTLLGANLEPARKVAMERITVPPEAA